MGAMSYRSINGVTRSLIALLESHLSADPTLRPFFDITAGGTMVVSARTPDEMDDADQSGLSVWLYHLTRDPDLLNHPPRRIAHDRLEAPRLPLRLRYLMTPVVNEGGDAGNDPGLEHYVLGKILQTFHDHPVLAGPDLRGDLIGSGEQIGVRLEPLGLEEITRVWDALNATFQLCVSYEVSLAMICSDMAVSAVTPVDSVTLETGLVEPLGTS
jgi:hypothetical protein